MPILLQFFLLSLGCSLNYVISDILTLSIISEFSVRIKVAPCKNLKLPFREFSYQLLIELLSLLSIFIRGPWSPFGLILSWGGTIPTFVYHGLGRIGVEAKSFTHPHPSFSLLQLLHLLLIGLTDSIQVRRPGHHGPVVVDKYFLSSHHLAVDWEAIANNAAVEGWSLHQWSLLDRWKHCWAPRRL